MQLDGVHNIGLGSGPEGRLMKGNLAVPSGTQDLAGVTVPSWVGAGVMEMEEDAEDPRSGLGLDSAVSLLL